MDYGRPVYGKVVDEDPIVVTKSGPVRGIARDGIAVFRGIPYGADCTGRNRFRRAKEVHPWEEVLDCTRNGAIAIQLGDAGNGIHDYFTAGKPENFGFERANADNRILNVAGVTKGTGGNLQRENCLVANILTPGIDDRKRAVVVYIHGGGFATGSGTLTFGADDFAKEQDIVVCSLHHRLNVFGFLYLGDIDEEYKDSGIVGMLDLVLGLRWIHENIDRFGGDPDRITLMGESGGAMKICTLLNMPISKGLYRSAIIESGSGKVGEDNCAAATAITRSILKRLEIKENELERLNDIPVDQLLQAAEPYMMQFRPVPDGTCLQFQKEPKYAAEPMAYQIPIIVGSSEDEMAGMILGEGRPSVTEENLSAYAKKTLQDNTGKSYTDEEVQRVIRVCRKYSSNDAEQVYWFISSFSSFLGGNAFFHAKERVTEGGAAVYSYLNALDSPTPDGLLPESRRYSWHVSDLPLQFHIVLHKEFENVSASLANAWGAFIRTQNPSTKELEWPQYEKAEGRILLVDRKMEIIDDFREELAKAMKLC